MADSRAIQVNNYPSSIPKAVVENLFGIYGEINKLWPTQGEDEDHIGYLIEYKDPTSAAKATNANGIEVLPNERPVVQLFTGRLPGRGRLDLDRDVTVDHEKARRETLERTVYIGNLYERISLDDIGDYFAVCGPIRARKLVPERTQESASALIEFVYPKSARLAVDHLSGNWLGDRPFEIIPAESVIGGRDFPMVSHDQLRASVEAPAKMMEAEAEAALADIEKRLMAKRARVE
ncbi:RNA recognition motif [Carpediemonas membranifera]|uniref:RNA recognition motif n=1 Tax=Carpediemonas membranifera TaxID=201153 RepID=A0A8J6B0S0_9EUKA|nr:RNA recognition motif [Carpediemonas membranifera]|eukprot:KAG9395955.1 RNA recognition motif [Carpediemonas membranifera]